MRRRRNYGKPLPAKRQVKAHLQLFALVQDAAIIEGVEMSKSQWQFLDDMRLELEKADAQHSPYNSYHEAYAVILEELDEFWEIVRKKTQERNDREAYIELVQIAVTAWRTARDLNLE